MKFYLYIITIFSLASYTQAAEFRECRVAKDTSTLPWKMSTEPVLAGSLAITHEGEKIGLKEIVSDTPVFFLDSAGSISKSYQWMYSPIGKVEGREDKYFSTPSWNDDVIITIRAVEGSPGKTSVAYIGVRRGNYLTLICD